jgi:hypothetical protein
MMVMVSLQNKVATIPFVEFGSNIFGDGRHRVNIVMNTLPLPDQIKECCFPIGHLDSDFLENARWNCSDDYRIHRVASASVRRVKNSGIPSSREA